MKQTKIITNTIIIFVLIGISGCGLFSGGNLEDDADNWGRAFHSKKPDDVIVLHSRYWQSYHWTLEFEYFFEIESNQQLSEQLFTQNKLIRLEGQGAVLAKGEYFGDCPEWFAPKTIDEYEIWAYEDGEGSNFRVFVDKESGNLFITDYQV